MIPLASLTIVSKVAKGLLGWILDNPAKVFFIILISALLMVKCSLDNAKEKIEKQKAELSVKEEEVKSATSTINAIPGRVKAANQLRTDLQSVNKKEEERIKSIPLKDVTEESLNKMWQDRLTEIEEASK